MMDPQYYTPTTSGDPLPKLVRFVSLALFAIAIILLILTFARGKVRFDVPSHSIVYVNGHRVSTSSLSLKAGDYTIRVVSPKDETYESTHRVYLWPTTYKPTLKQRAPDAILSSVIGANGLYGKPGLSDAKWFEGDTWLVGVVGPGNATPIALHFGQDGWEIGYYPVGNYPQSLKTIPADIAACIQNLEVKYAD